MLRRRLVLARTALALALAGGTAAAQAAPAFWAVRDGDSTVYLFGTAHVARPDAQWRTPALDAAIKSSSTLWLEIQNSEDKAATAGIVQKLGLDPAQPLAGKLSPAQNQKLDLVLSQFSFPAAKVAPMRPWLAALTLSMLPLAKAGLDPKAGADVVIRSVAKAEGDRIDGFDTPEQQVRYLADLPEPEQIAFLEAVLDRAASGTALPLTITEAWEKGDLQTIDSILNKELKERSPLLYKRLLVERNQRYASRIRELLDGKEDQLVAVGVGHLVGEDSIQSMLEAKGLTVKRVQ